jgi:hypothetical protein
MLFANGHGTYIEDVGIIDILARELYESTVCTVKCL